MNRLVERTDHIMMNKMEELANTVKLSELLHKKEQSDKTKNVIITILAIIGTVAAVAGIAYAVYRYFAPDYLEEFDDEFEDEFEDEDDEDEFEDEEASEEEAAE